MLTVEICDSYRNTVLPMTLAPRMLAQPWIQVMHTAGNYKILVLGNLIFLCFCKLISKFTKECLVLVGKDIELDAIGRHFEPYPYRRMRLHAGGALVV